MQILRLLKCMLQLVLAPTKGWEDISLDDDRLKRPVTPAYYLFIAIVSLSWLVQWLYYPQLDLLTVVVRIILTFTTLFVSLFIATFILSVALQSLTADSEVNEDKVKTLTVYGLSLLSAIMLIANVCPTDTPVLGFLPGYVIVILWKGYRYVNVKANKIGLYAIVAFCAVLLPPLLFGFLFKTLL